MIRGLLLFFVLDMIRRHLLLLILAAICAAQPVTVANAQATSLAHLTTPWSAKVNQAAPLPEYPRPQLERDTWTSLNGLWDYAVRPRETSAPPAAYDGKILVPYPIESALSGVMKQIGDQNRLWYHRTFEVPPTWKNKRILLHFGAVDWDATVWVNGKEVGKHSGGYDGFSFDIADALKPTASQEIVVAIWDPSDAGPQPRGKQVSKPRSIWYTPTTGIWQTVWLEPVATTHIESLKITPNIDKSAVMIEPHISGFHLPGKNVVRVEVYDQKKRVGKAEVNTANSSGISVPIPGAKLWSPDSPFLYDLKVMVFNDGKIIDQVKSYFGMRKIAMARDNRGRLRIHLNNKPCFMLGPLDQGFWPDGLYTAPTDEALRYDVEVMKKLGFNMVRKHVKVEPERWYYWCDKLGLLVWQDMPSGDKSAEWRAPFEGKEMNRTAESAAIYERELRALLDGRYNHPSIVVWVPFNEGWGQFDTIRILNLTKQLDPTRLVDGASGGNHFPAGDLIDHHQYPGPGVPPAVTDRAMVLGEFGGLGLPIKGHTWQDEKNWGYRSFKTSEELTEAYIGLIKNLQPMIEATGLSAAVYTQLTDVETEVNGLMTYDRKVIKLPVERLAGLHRELTSAKK
jgi:beta-galactosidase/beta-glucuronidase